MSEQGILPDKIHIVFVGMSWEGNFEKAEEGCMKGE